MSDTFILDADGNPQDCDDLFAWGRWMQNAKRHVADDKTHNDTVRVSTVFLGLDHSFGHGLPVLFETMIFGGPHDGYTERYATRDEAIEGHAKALELARA